ncbi:MAG TPA: MarR family transcriptional regulator [Acidimicrobiales bacterium]|nr:MarR family transcriptional regulator [Acidimicrobiales bacterium]
MNPTPNDDRRRLMVRCAWLYHESGLTQEEIAGRLGVSRSTVSRALSQAAREGIVEVVITEPYPEALRLETVLTERLGVAAVVGMVGPGEDPGEAAGRAAARRLEAIVTPGDVSVAIGWGRTLSRMIPFLRRRKTRRVRIVGAIGHSVAAYGLAVGAVVRDVGAAFGAETHVLPAPLYSPGRGLTDALTQNVAVAETLEMARRADVVFTSIGRAESSNPLVAEGMLTPDAMAELLSRGAVGDLLANFFDPEGRPLVVENFVPLGLGLEDLRAARRVVAMACGPERVPAVLGAVAGDYVSELVLDSITAEALLAATGPGQPDS